MKIETQLEFVPDHNVATVVFTKKSKIISKKKHDFVRFELVSSHDQLSISA